MLNPVLQVEFRAIFEPFSFSQMAQNVTQYCHVRKSQTTSGPPVGRPTLSLHASEIEDNDLRQCAC